MLDNWSSSLPRHLLTQSHPRRVVVTLFRPLPSRPGPRPRRYKDPPRRLAQPKAYVRGRSWRGRDHRRGRDYRRGCMLRPDDLLFWWRPPVWHMWHIFTRPRRPPHRRSFLLTLQGSDRYSLPVSPICLLHYVVLSHPLCKVLPKICLWLQKVLTSPSFRGPVACPSLSSTTVPSTRTMITPKHLGNGIPTFE